MLTNSIKAIFLFQKGAKSNANIFIINNFYFIKY